MIVTVLLEEDLIAINPSPHRSGFKKPREEQLGENNFPLDDDTLSEPQERATPEGHNLLLPE